MRNYAIPVAWVFGSAFVLYGSWLGDAHLTYRGVSLANQHRLSLAATLFVIVTVESIILAAILRPRSYMRSWGRALLAALFLSACFWVFTDPLDRPAAAGFNALWLLVLAVICWVLCIISIVSKLRSRRTTDT
jgi:hypothetical protein